MKAKGGNNAPEGGWGWVVVFATFVISFLSFGTMGCLGIFFEIFIKEFNSTRSEVSTVASIAFSLQSFLGPLVSILQQRIPPRIVVFVGCLLISVSFISSAFAPNIFCLYFTIGLIGGVGLALAYLPTIVLISFYFTKKRSLATALGCLGTFAGCFIHPYVLQLLISEYDWRGTFLLIGGLALNSAAVSILLRPIKAPSVTQEVESGIQDTTTETDRSRTNLEIEGHIGSKTSMNSVRRDSTADQRRVLERLVEEAVEHDAREQEHNDANANFRLSSVTDGDNDGAEAFECSDILPDIDSPASKRQDSVLVAAAAGADGPTGRQLSNRFNVLHAKSQRSTRGKPSNESNNDGEASNVNRQTSTTSNVSILMPSSTRRNILRRLSGISRMSSISGVFSAGVLPPPPFPNIMQPSDAATDSKMEGIRKQNLSASVLWRRIVNRLKSMGEYYKDPNFGTFLVANFLICIPYYSPAMFIVDYGRQLGFSTESSTMLLSLIGIGNILGRPLMALLGDYLADYRMPLFAVAVGISGAITMLNFFVNNFYFLAFFIFQFAFLTGGSQTFLTPILADMIPMSQLSLAFGFVIAVQGMAILVGSPLLAQLPAYYLTFTVAGSLLLVSSFLLIIVDYRHIIFCCFFRKETFEPE